MIGQGELDYGLGETIGLLRESVQGLKNFFAHLRIFEDIYGLVISSPEDE